MLKEHKITITNYNETRFLHTDCGYWTTHNPIHSFNSISYTREYANIFGVMNDKMWFQKTDRIKIQFKNTIITVRLFE